MHVRFQHCMVFLFSYSNFDTAKQTLFVFILVAAQAQMYLYCIVYWDDHENWSDPRPNQSKEDLKKKKKKKESR